ncbi:hypothetical protein NXW48_20945 [Phocaeicola vulgatus]|nr:hypothetical protein [Phocaeicola vulgatus]
MLYAIQPPLIYLIGTDIDMVRNWMGHSSIDTTNIYAEISMERKLEAPKKGEHPLFGAPQQKGGGGGGEKTLFEKTPPPPKKNYVVQNVKERLIINCLDCPT